ncbi:MAG TPA: hypothetical protein VFL81_00110, partial [Candidatus Saccharimonadales bacterium]|nr:hypothetical protein [Candidatus Saccharimonadales bacterium]
WMSGILWSVDRIHNNVIHDIFMINPITFFAEGYRQTLFGHTWFFEEPKRMIAFVGIFALMTGLAYVTFKRARKEIVDVL